MEAIAQPFGLAHKLPIYNLSDPKVVSLANDQRTMI
jgi:hypothetical protein